MENTKSGVTKVMVDDETKLTFGLCGGGFFCCCCYFKG